MNNNPVRTGYACPPRLNLSKMYFFCFYPVSPVSIFCYIDFNPLLKRVNRNFFYSACMQCHCYKQVFPVGCVQNKRIWVWSYKMKYCNKATVIRWLPHSQQQKSYLGLRSLQFTTTADYFTVTPPLVFPRNDIYGQGVTTQIWVMVLTGWGKFPFLAGPMRST